MKATATLFLPSTLSKEEVMIIQSQVKTYCDANGMNFGVGTATKRVSKLVVKRDEELVKLGKFIGKALSYNTEKMGDFSETVVGLKNIRQYLLGNRKTNQHPYPVDHFSTTEGDPEYDPALWARKKGIDPDQVTRDTRGKVVITTPVHLLDDSIICLDYDKPPEKRVYRIKGSSKPYRQFDGTPKRHCSGCPFEDGCVMCCLP